MDGANESWKSRVSCQDHTARSEPSFRVQRPLQSPIASPTVGILLNGLVQSRAASHNAEPVS